MESQEQCDRMKQLCIDNDLPIWGDEIAFSFYDCIKYNLLMVAIAIEQFAIFNTEILPIGKSQVTESEFIQLLKNR